MKKKRVFLLLPETYDDANQCSYFPTTVSFNRSKPDDCVLMNVYEYFRTFCEKKKATELSLDMLAGFDELWYYGAFGITKPMHYILKVAQKLELPIKDVQPISCKDSFSLAYKFALDFHPSQTQDDTYWNQCIKACGEYTKDNNPLNAYLILSIIEYFDDIYHKRAPDVPADDLFKGEFRTALNFAAWTMKNNIKFADGIDLSKVSKTPTPMLKALVDGFYKYYWNRQSTLELNEKRRE